MKMKMKMSNISHQCDINGPRPIHGHKYGKHIRVSQYHDDSMHYTVAKQCLLLNS